MQLRSLSAIAAAGLASVAAASTAEPPPASETAEALELCVDLVCIEGDELELYQAMETALSKALQPGVGPEETVEIIGRSLQLIDELPLDERFRRSLVRKLSQMVTERASSPRSVVLDLMESPAPGLQEVAFGVLFSLDGALGGDFRGSLLETMREPETPIDTRQAILWWFHYVGAFAEVEDSALELAHGEAEPELAHEAARVLLEDISQRSDGTKRILELFHSSSSILRSRAALVIVGQNLAAHSSPVRNEAVAVVGELAKDPTQPPWARGQAIEVLSLHGDAGMKPNRSILLELLDHRHWFFGASGAHFPVHSLALVIAGLQGTGDPEIMKALRDLRPLLPTLRSGEREYVEWVLDNALGNSREIFHGPIDPNRERN